MRGGYNKRGLDGVDLFFLFLLFCCLTDGLYECWGDMIVCNSDGGCGCFVDIYFGFEWGGGQLRKDKMELTKRYPATSQGEP